MRSSGRTLGGGGGGGVGPRPKIIFSKYGHVAYLKGNQTYDITHANI